MIIYLYIKFLIFELQKIFVMKRFEMKRFEMKYRLDIYSI